MDLRGFQIGLARLLIDAPLRRCASAGQLGPALAERGLDLDPATLAALTTLATRSANELERAALSLQLKRRRAVEATVPHTVKLWPELGDRYLELLAENPARTADLDPALGPGPSELLRCLPDLRAAALADPLPPPWTADLLALELTRACSRRDGRARRLVVAHPVVRVLEHLDAGWVGVESRPARCEIHVDAERIRWRVVEPRT